MELASGDLVAARYRLERRIGEGGMGVVWAAEDAVAHGRVALKLLKDVAGDPDAPKRLVREARAAAAVRHPNVVHTLDAIDLGDGSPVLVMELLDGESLRERLRREPRIAVRELAAIMVQVVSAVGAAHALGIVHRDLKPENIFLCHGPTAVPVVKILDFGIAKLTALDGEARRSTGLTTGAVLGTPEYMAPEQVFAEADLDHRADIWALGLIIYQCLSGVLPTQAGSVGQVLKNVLARPFEPVERIVDGVPSELAQLVARMLSRERAARPGDLREVLAILEPIAEIEAPRFAAPAAAVRGSAVTLLPGAMPRQRWLSRSAARGIVAAVAVLGLGGAGWRWLRSDAPVVPDSPLAGPGARLACPVLEASGVDEPAGWLGAAAAATVCERARVILGGRPDRTLVPAELLGLSRRPLDEFPGDPYASPEARASSLAAARSRASAYVAGSVRKAPPGFRVALALHAADGRELARAEGAGRRLSEAVRDAMAPLVRPDLIPKAKQLDPEIAAWERTRDVDAALARLDVHLAMAQNGGGLQDECRGFAAISGRVGELGPAWLWLCAYTMGKQPPDVKLEDTDASPQGVATRLRLRHFLDREDPPDAADRLHALFERDTTSWGRSLLATTESCVVQPRDLTRAYDMAVIAVEEEPKNPSGERCDPWGDLVAMTYHRPTAGHVTRAMQAWVPWSSVGWSMQGRAEVEARAALVPLRRAYDLSPFDTWVVEGLVDALLKAGELDAARSVASAVAAGRLPVHQIASELLSLRIEASRAHFQAALALARTAFDISPDDAGWVRSQRLDVAWRALEVANLLGTAPALAELLVQRFLDADPLRIDGSAITLPARIAAICATAPPAASARCFARVRALRGRLSGGTTEETDALLRGAERYAAREFDAAAAAWRPLLGGSAPLAAMLPDAMAEVFDATDNAEIAERVDQAVMQRGAEFGGATMGHVRAARRALLRGDRARARSLANQVVVAWQFADQAPPALTEMQHLVRRLDERPPR